MTPEEAEFCICNECSDEEESRDSCLIQAAALGILLAVTWAALLLTVEAIFSHIKP